MNSPTNLNIFVYIIIDMNKISLKRFDKIYRTTNIEELKDLYRYKIDEETLFHMDGEWEEGRVVEGLILIDTKKREAKRYAGSYKIKLEEIEVQYLNVYYYSDAIVHLVKWNRIVIGNELENLLTDDQFFIWYLKDYHDISYSEIASLREHFGKSGNESTIRDIYMKAKIKMKKLFHFCNKYSEYVKEVEETD